MIVIISKDIHKRQHVHLTAQLFLCSDKDANEERKYVEIKFQLDATEVFIADLIACSTCFGHHYGAEGYVSGLQDVAAYCKPDT